MTYGLEEALDLGDGTAGGLRSMSKDTWAIIGAMGMFGAIIVSLGAVGINQIGSRIDDLRNDMIIGFDLLDSRFDDLDGDVDNLRTDVRPDERPAAQRRDRVQQGRPAAADPRAGRHPRSREHRITPARGARPRAHRSPSVDGRAATYGLFAGGGEILR